MCLVGGDWGLQAEMHRRQQHEGLLLRGRCPIKAPPAGRWQPPEVEEKRAERRMAWKRSSMYDLGGSGFHKGNEQQ